MGLEADERRVDFLGDFPGPKVDRWGRVQVVADHARQPMARSGHRAPGQLPAAGGRSGRADDQEPTVAVGQARDRAEDVFGAQCAAFGLPAVVLVGGTREHRSQAVVADLVQWGVEQLAHGSGGRRVLAQASSELGHRHGEAL